MRKAQWGNEPVETMEVLWQEGDVIRATLQKDQSDSPGKADTGKERLAMESQAATIRC